MPLKISISPKPKVVNLWVRYNPNDHAEIWENISVPKGNVLRWQTYTFSCCFIRQLSGTSSAFVYPPNGWSKRMGFLNPISSNLRRVSVISKAWPLCTGFRSWNANTASALRLWNSSRSSAGDKRKRSRPSLYLIGSTTSKSPPMSQSPAFFIVWSTYGRPEAVVPQVLAIRSSFGCL